MCAFDRLKIRPLTRITSTLWNSVIDVLNELYGWLTDGTKDINVDEVYGRTAHFRERIDCEGRPVLLDGDPISISEFSDRAKSQITEAIDVSSILSRLANSLDQIYGKLEALEKYLEVVAARPQGYTYQLGLEVAELTVVDFVEGDPHAPLFSITIINDGPDEVYVSVNAHQKNAPMKPGESLTIDMRSPKIEKLYLDVDSGKRAYIRAFGIY